MPKYICEISASSWSYYKEKIFVSIHLTLMNVDDDDGKEH